MRFIKPLLNEIRRTMAEVCTSNTKVGFNDLSHSDLIADRRAAKPRLFSRENVITYGLLFGGLSVAALSASVVATPVLAVGTLIASHLSRYVTMRYMPARRLLMENALAEGLSEEDARAHVDAMRKISNGFNAPLVNLKLLSTSHLGTENAPHKGAFTFVGKTTKAFRESVEAVYAALPRAIQFRMKALNIKLQAYQDISQDKAGVFPDAADWIGFYSDAEAKGPRSVNIVNCFFEGTPNELASIDAAYLNGKFTPVQPDRMISSLMYQAARSVDDTLLLGKGNYSSNARFKAKHNVELASLLGQTPWGKIDRKGIDERLASSKTVFAASFQQAYILPCPDMIDASPLFPKSVWQAKTLAASHERAVQTNGHALWSFFYHVPTPKYVHGFMNAAQGNQVAAQQMLFYITAMEDGGIRQDWIETWKKRAPTDFVKSVHAAVSAKVATSTPRSARDSLLLKITEETLAARKAMKPKRPRKSLGGIKTRHRFHIS